MTTLQLDSNGTGWEYSTGTGGSGYGTGWEDSAGNGGGTGIGYGESRGEGYGTGYRHYAIGDTGDGGSILSNLSAEQVSHDILTTHDALEALTFL